VKYFRARLEVAGKDLRDLKGIKIGAIGPKTAGTWRELGINPDLVPDEYRAEAVVEAFQEQDSSGIRILLPRAAQAREILPQELRKMGATIDVVPAYQTVLPHQDTARVAELFEQGAIDMVTFTSSSTVTNFFSMFESHEAELHKWMARVTVACIGPITARTAKENGLTVRLVPDEYTIEGLTEGIVEFYRSNEVGA
jgi:uroporphyrinogen III methyltransferase/synthase